MKIVVNRILNPTDRVLCLSGPMGCGKSSVGKSLAKGLGMSFADLDDIIEADNQPIAEIFAQKGEEYFRNLENYYLEKSCKLYNILSIGGGTTSHRFEALRNRNASYLHQNAINFCLMPSLDLDESVSILVERLKGEADKRPVLMGDPNRIRTVMHDRLDFYKRNCDVIVYDGRSKPAETAMAVALKYREMFTAPL